MNTSQGLDTSEQGTRAERPERHIDQSAYSLTSICSPAKTIYRICKILLKEKVVSFNIICHVLYSVSANLRTPLYKYLIN